MNLLSVALSLTAVLLMLVAALLPHLLKLDPIRLWRSFTGLSSVALIASVLTLFIAPESTLLSPWLQVSTVGMILAVLVQLLGTVIGVFSSRYLEGEPAQRGYIAALGGCSQRCSCYSWRITGWC